METYVTAHHDYLHNPIPTGTQPQAIGRASGQRQDGVRACLGQAIQDHLGGWLQGNPQRVAAIIDRIVRGSHRG
ncbi:MULTISPECIES: hypothetical protein [unclassified Streptomyces]|uniref:hypothetical protein n=1 Tax=unclassified Streptomyces TaxID=2593676 RepID=UPI000369C8E5|nr:MULTISPECIES: hypothetical protein [unclassified Streptomyces]MYY04545.1 hypothetical protein [Streptomyces sp. SID4913]